MQANQFAFKTLSEEALLVGKKELPISKQLNNWRCFFDSDGENVQWWCLDQDDSNTNTLSQSVLTELHYLINQFKDKQSKNHDLNQTTKAIVIRSLKENGFAAGADINEFKNQTDPLEVEHVLQEGRGIFLDLEQLPLPTIALLHGFCFGGGLELALACRYRITRTDTKLGFPEVKLGLHPGLGGTVRLTRQIEATEALKIMLTGKPVSAGRAKKLGLVDAVGEEHHFRNMITSVIKGTLSRRGHTAKTKLLNKRPSIKLIAMQSEKKTRSKVSPDHYPAPFALIDLYRHYGHSRGEMFKEEGVSFAKLLCGHTSQQLIRVFFLREGLKAKPNETPFQHVHVVGAGAMGGDIATWCALRGLKVTLEDVQAQLISPALKRGFDLFDKKCRSKAEQRQARDRLIPDCKGNGRKQADLIIEAVPEKIDLKSELLCQLEMDKRPDAILATNTSSILLETLRNNLQHQENFVGIHFFNPVAKMPLVEVVTHDKLDDSVRNKVNGFITQIDRLPIVVKSKPGFLVNRVLTPYLLEAMALLDEGRSKSSIDYVAEQFGMPMGPIELADFIGLDICLHVADTLIKELEQPLYAVPAWFRDMVAADKLGIKTGEGFYKYDNDNKPQKGALDKPDQHELQTLQDRLLLPLLNTCVHCLDEEIVATADQLDAAVIFGAGFPPFTGGPLQYAVDRGVANIVEKLEAFADRYNDARFSPAQGWSTLLEEHEKQSHAS